MAANICGSDTCENAAEMVCPSCVKVGLPPTYFCSQDCFKASWNTHKKLHKMAKALMKMAAENKDMNGNYNPYPDYQYSGTQRPYPISGWRAVPDHIPRPDYADDGEPTSEMLADRRGNSIPVYTDEEIAGMREVCRLAREVLTLAGKAVAPGVTCDQIDEIVHNACIERNAYPSPLNYKGFRKSVCTSVNEVICHGIPDAYELKDGDIVNIDVTLYFGGFHGDLNETFLVGDVDESGQNVVETAYECLNLAIEACEPGMRYRDIGRIIETHANSRGCSVVKAYCGHGIGSLFHTEPSIPHYTKNKARGVMKPGHIFTIEPMINEGTWHDQLWPDDWTSTTTDGKRSAQFEHTLLITEDGVEILTARPDGGNYKNP